jgi:hypothetical protein
MLAFAATGPAVAGDFPVTNISQFNSADLV